MMNGKNSSQAHGNKEINLTIVGAPKYSPVIWAFAETECKHTPEISKEIVAEVRRGTDNLPTRALAIVIKTSDGVTLHGIVPALASAAGMLLSRTEEPLAGELSVIAARLASLGVPLNADLDADDFDKLKGWYTKERLYGNEFRSPDEPIMGRLIRTMLEVIVTMYSGLASIGVALITAAGAPGKDEPLESGTIEQFENAMHADASTLAAILRLRREDPIAITDSIMSTAAQTVATFSGWLDDDQKDGPIADRFSEVLAQWAATVEAMYKELIPQSKGAQSKGGLKA